MGRKISREDKLKRQFRKIVKLALKEDVGRGDITTDAIVTDEQTLGIIFPKDDGILCGVDLAKMVFEEIDPNIDFQKKLNDGDSISPGMTIATL
ncbi:MAG: hypothetical protein JSV97_05170, partial [candidate division WOR-3 bacterium]